MASKKKVATKRQVWNKGLEVGKRDAFTPAQVKRIRGLLARYVGLETKADPIAVCRAFDI